MLIDWIWNFLLSFFAPRIANDIGPLILLIFFGMLVFGYIYVYLFIPETKGLSLEEVYLPLTTCDCKTANRFLFRSMKCTAKEFVRGNQLRSSLISLRSIKENIPMRFAASHHQKESAK